MGGPVEKDNEWKEKETTQAPLRGEVLIQHYKIGDASKKKKVNQIGKTTRWQRNIVFSMIGTGGKLLSQLCQKASGVSGKLRTRGRGESSNQDPEKSVFKPHKFPKPKRGQENPKGAGRAKK